MCRCPGTLARDPADDPMIVVSKCFQMSANCLQMFPNISNVSECLQMSLILSKYLQMLPNVLAFGCDYSSDSEKDCLHMCYLC